MDRFLLKSAFGYDALREMNAGDVVKVACQTWLECRSVKSLCSQFKKSYPNEGISRYESDTEKQGTGFIVTITAVA